MRKPTDSQRATRQVDLDRSVLHKVNQEIYRRFPEVAGQVPQVQGHAPAAYRLVYKGEVTTANNRRMLRWVRVVVTDQGEILKITTSH